MTCIVYCMVGTGTTRILCCKAMCCQCGGANCGLWFVRGKQVGNAVWCRDWVYIPIYTRKTGGKVPYVPPIDSKRVTYGALEVQGRQNCVRTIRLLHSLMPHVQSGPRRPRTLTHMGLYIVEQCNIPSLMCKMSSIRLLRHKSRRKNIQAPIHLQIYSLLSS